MGEVAAIVKIKAHDGITWLEQGGVDGVVGWGAAEGLDVDVQFVGADPVGGKEFGRPAASEGFQYVGILDTFIVARIAITAVVGHFHLYIQDFSLALLATFRPRIAFGVDMAEGSAQGLPYGLGSGALRSNKDDGGVLPLVFKGE
jgi:hypothetical protein